MKAVVKSLGGAAALLVVLGVMHSLAWADKLEKETPEEQLKAVAKAAQPGEEHAKLKPLAGRWTYTCKLWMDPSKPPMESEGTIERNWVLGGRFLEERFAGTGVAGQSDFEGVGLVGYDSGRKKYTCSFACNMGTGICTGLGDADSEGKVFTFQSEAYCPVAQKVVQSRDVVRIESEDRVVMESYQIENGHERKVMELVSVRQE
ncbi:MAG: DUF1579 domain-containing protein [Pirellulales bacterium]|nr:DUF1579 domain-containing protein [Pirellulales bacterium]